MFTLLGFILVGAFIGLVLYLTYVAWKNRINEKIKQRNAKKAVSAKLSAMAKNCANKVEFDQLDKLAKEGYTHVMAGMDNSDNIVGDVDLIKDKEHDAQVEALHNRTGEGVIVIED